MQENSREVWRVFQTLAKMHPECNAVKLVTDLQRWYVQAQQTQIMGTIALKLAHPAAAG